MSRYLAIDGADGCGKSSQAAALCEWLRAEGKATAHVREPGSTPVGEALRALLLARTTGDLLPLTEALLFTAARAELVAKEIAPALRAGKVVVAERCFASTLVYQSLAARPGIDFDWALDLTRRAHGAVLPDRVFVLDLPAFAATQRRAARAVDRFEARDPDWHERVRAAYLAFAAREPSAVVVDAARPFAAVQAELRERVRELL